MLFLADSHKGWGQMALHVVLIFICTMASENCIMVGAGRLAHLKDALQTSVLALVRFLGGHLKPGLAALVTPALGREKQKDSRGSPPSLL